jgi:hypothetical protein
MRLLALTIGLSMATPASLAFIGTPRCPPSPSQPSSRSRRRGLAFTAVAERAGFRWAGRALGIQNASVVAFPLIAAAVIPVRSELAEPEG